MPALPLQGKYAINVYCVHNDHACFATAGQARHQRLLRQAVRITLCFRSHDNDYAWQGKYAFNVYFVHSGYTCFATAGQVRHQRLLCSQWPCLLCHCRASTPSTSTVFTMTMLALPLQGKYAINVYCVHNDHACFATAGQVRHQRLLRQAVRVAEPVWGGGHATQVPGWRQQDDDAALPPHVLGAHQGGRLHLQALPRPLHLGAGETEGYYRGPNKSINMVLNVHRNRKAY